MQFPDSTLLALDLPSHEPSRFGHTLVAALVLTAAAICAALWIEVGTSGERSAKAAPALSAAALRSPTR